MTAPNGPQEEFARIMGGLLPASVPNDSIDVIGCDLCGAPAEIDKQGFRTCLLHRRPPTEALSWDV